MPAEWAELPNKLLQNLTNKQQYGTLHQSLILAGRHLAHHPHNHDGRPNLATPKDRDPRRIRWVDNLVSRVRHLGRHCAVDALNMVTWISPMKVMNQKIQRQVKRPSPNKKVMQAVGHAVSDWLSSHAATLFFEHPTYRNALCAITDEDGPYFDRARELYLSQGGIDFDNDDSSDSDLAMNLSNYIDRHIAKEVMRQANL